MIGEKNITTVVELDKLAQEEVVEIAQALVRFDTSNFGDEKTKPERKAAEYVAGLMSEVGLEPVIFESKPGRASVVTRIEGDGSSDRGALLVHGHLDVVPAVTDDWSLDPFSAEITTDPLYGEVLWGRGTVDMKDMDAMMLAVMRRMQRFIAAGGERPARDIVFAFFADEEAGGELGASWAVDNKAELFEGVTEAISEVGGFSATVGKQRIYLLQTAEKGLAWLKLVAHGSAGHGSRIEMGGNDNAVTKIAAALARIGEYEWPVDLTDTTRSCLEMISEYTGLTLDEKRPEELAKTLGPIARFLGASLRNTTNPTGLFAGYKHNVIPGVAEGWVDARILPGQHDCVMGTIKELAGEDVDVEYVVRDVDLEVPFKGLLVEQMVGALTAHDPESKVVPYSLAGGTDNKSLSRLGIKGYGFAPLRLPDELDFTALFHGIDERVPLDSLRFGTQVLWDFVRKQ